MTRLTYHSGPEEDEDEQHQDIGTAPVAHWIGQICLFFIILKFRAKIVHVIHNAILCPFLKFRANIGTQKDVVKNTLFQGRSSYLFIFLYFFFFKFHQRNDIACIYAALRKL